MRVSTLTLCLAALLAPAPLWARQAAETPLADAAMNRDVETVRSLLENGIDPDQPQADRTTALHWAARNDDTEIAALLIEAGADVRTKNRTGATPLYLACVNGSAEMIRMLLDAGEDADAVVTSENETALMLAAFTGSVEAVDLLIDRGADVNHPQVRGQTALMWAAEEGHADVVATLLAHGADVNGSSVASSRQERRPPGQMTALLFAARQGHLEAARLLVEAGADPNQVMADGTSPMLMAIVNGHYELARYLLDQGADPNRADRVGRAPLYAAIDMRNVQWAAGPAPTGDRLDVLDLIRALARAGADPNARLTAKVGNRGAFDMRWNDMVGATPFLRASQNGDIEVMQLLLAYGADPYVETTSEETALHLLGGVGWPLGQGHIRSEGEILEAYALLTETLGLDPNVGTKDGITPLMGAAYKGENIAVQFLVDHGARLDLEDKEGRTALAWSQGVLATLAQPRRRQPQTEALIRELMEAGGPGPTAP